MMGLLGLAGQPSFESAYIPRQRGLAEIGGSALLQALPYIAMAYGGGLGGMGGGADLAPALAMSGLTQQSGGVGASGFYAPLGVDVMQNRGLIF